MPSRDPADGATILAEDGSDAIFITGAPGSKWSAIAHALSLADEINMSDIADHRAYTSQGTVLHFGNYFGPGMEHGERFDRLGETDKHELVRELGAPYARPGGVKLLKSHLFARHLDHLVSTFPRARFVLVYRTDEECVDWWINAGGFDISFPDYSWYRELSNMRDQVAIDNAAMLAFADRHELKLKRLRSLKPLLAELDLTWSAERLLAHAADPIGSETSDPEALAAALHARAVEVRLACFHADRLAAPAL